MLYQNLDFLTQAFVYFSKIRALLVLILNLKGLRSSNPCHLEKVNQ